MLTTILFDKDREIEVVYCEAIDKGSPGKKNNARFSIKLTNSTIISITENQFNQLLDNELIELLAGEWPVSIYKPRGGNKIFRRVNGVVK